MILVMKDHQQKRVCSVEGCEQRYFGKGYCGRHYQRVLKHGHAEQTRPGDWGTRKSHPLYQTWQNLLRREAGVSDDWDRFEDFLRDVRERPTANHGLYPQRPHDPIGPDNFRWVLMGGGMERPRRRSDSCKVKGCKKAAHALDLCHMHHARWLRRGTLEDPAPRVVDLEKRRAKQEAERLWKYRLTPAQFEQMRNRQGGVCAICAEPEQGEKPLSVDHCHDTGAVRGLLCSRCNTGIGMLGDDEERLRIAAEYLRASRRAEAG